LKGKCAEGVVRIMVAKHPRLSAEAILQFLIDLNGATAGAVFRVREEPRLFVGRSISQESLEWTEQAWAQDAISLRAGRLSRTDTRLLLPLLRRGRFAALVYLETPQVDLASLAELSGILVDAVEGEPQKPEPSSPVETYLEWTPTAEIESRRLGILLERFDWNLARVARELNLSRTTLYRRLEVLGIPRQRAARKTTPGRKHAATTSAPLHHLKQTAPDRRSLHGARRD
jgi:AraC-like DNA-binding protein